MKLFKETKKFLYSMLLVTIFTLMAAISVSASCAHEFIYDNASAAQKTSITLPGQWKDHKWYPAHQETRYATKLTLKWKASKNATHYAIAVFQNGDRKAIPGDNIEHWKKTSYSGKINLRNKGKIKIEITPYNGAIPGKKITKTITVK